MLSLKRNEFIDDASSDSLSNGCGWLLDCCLSSCEIDVVALSIFLQMNDDSDVSLMLAASFCSGHLCA